RLRLGGTLSSCFSFQFEWVVRAPTMNVKPAVIELDRSPMSLADISQCNRHVRFTPKSGHSPTRAACPLRAILLSLRASRLRQCSSDPMHAKGSGRFSARWCIVLKSSLHSAHFDSHGADL